MPLSPSTSRRALKHTRAIQIEAFARDDGLWDFDAHITDTKTCDTKLASDVRLPALSGFVQVLPTAANQAFAGELLDTRDGASADQQSHKPFQLDRCHALRSDGAAVAQYYPHWAVRPFAVSESS